MCVVCTDWLKGKMTSEEALRALGEMITTKPTKENEHYLETAGKILDKEVPFPKTDPALDKLWQKK